MTWLHNSKPVHGGPFSHQSCPTISVFALANFAPQVQHIHPRKGQSAKGSRRVC